MLCPHCLDAFNALDNFGYADSDFIPDFDPTPPVMTGMKDVYAGVYKRSDGQALAIVANLSKENKSGAVTLKAKYIGAPAGPIVSSPDKGSVQWAGDTVTLDIPSQCV